MADKQINTFTPLDTSISDTDNFLKQSIGWLTKAFSFSTMKSVLKTYFDGFYVLKTYSNRKVLKKAPTHFFENMDSGWINWYWWATAIHDSSIKHLWTASIQLPCPSWGWNVWMRKNITDLDLSGNYWFEFQLRSDNWTNVSKVEILLGNTGMTPNYWLAKLLDTSIISAATLENSAFIEFTISKEDFAVQTWVLDWANTQDMIVRASWIWAATPKVWIDSFRIVPQVWLNGNWYTLFSADDWWADQTNLLDIADKYGHKICLFIIPSAIGTAWYFTQGQIDTAHANWHTIALHGATALTSLTWTPLDTEIASIVAYRDAHMHYRGSHMFALPEGKINTEVQTKLTPHFKYIFSIDEWKGYPYDNEVLRIPRRSLLNTTATGVVTWLMDSAKNAKGLQIINFHHVITTAVISTDYSIANTDTVFAYTANPANGIKVPDWLEIFPK